MDYNKIHIKYKINSIQGRYLNLGFIIPILESFNLKNSLQIAGYSVQQRPIYKLELGHGKTKILMWSQMHGNESTTTKGLVDFINFLQGNSESAKMILSKYLFLIIPMLNPDGAEVYTRVNANEVDLNRDFQDLSQPESSLLMDLYKAFNPDYCFNLHDQRTIFGVGDSGKPATMSFLAPSFDESKSYDASRLKSVEMILRMANELKEIIPGQIGRFDDGFNINCVGDTFQSLQTPTILIEAGHFQNDYEREQTRSFVFIALFAAFTNDNENVVVDDLLTDYLNIPQNTVIFFDYIYKNVSYNYEGSEIITNFAVQFREELLDNKIVFNGFIAKVGNLDDFRGHIEYDAEGTEYTDNMDNIPKLDAKACFSIDNKVKFVNGLVKN